MKTLNDQNIRASLRNKLENQHAKPKAIIDELRIQNGKAIADVVALYNEPHCYEIKGENDKIERISSQGEFYNTSFRKITLVTTKENIKKAISIAPPFWGIIAAFTSGKTIKFKHIRKASTNPYFEKEIAALTLWKSEMLSILGDQKLKKQNRDYLASLISSELKKAELSSNISQLLLNRKLGKQIRQEHQ